MIDLQKKSTEAQWAKNSKINVITCEQVGSCTIKSKSTGFFFGEKTLRLS